MTCGLLRRTRPNLAADGSDAYSRIQAKRFPPINVDRAGEDEPKHAFDGDL
jgi:hypothetical protein